MTARRAVKAGSGVVSASPMADSSCLLKSGQLDIARTRLARDGYLLLRGYLPKGNVLQVQGCEEL